MDNRVVSRYEKASTLIYSSYNNPTQVISRTRTYLTDIPYKIRNLNLFQPRTDLLNSLKALTALKMHFSFSTILVTSLTTLTLASPFIDLQTARLHGLSARQMVPPPMRGHCSQSKDGKVLRYTCYREVNIFAD